MKKQGWTNNIYALNALLAWIYTQECVLLSVFGGKLGIIDYSFVSVGLPLVWAEVSVFSAFVVWKIKSENMAKINKDNITM